jgi:hypothetical protein
MKPPDWRMFRRSGRRFADKNMRQKKNPEHDPIPKERNMLKRRHRAA